MSELVLTIIAALLGSASIGANIGLWLKLRSELESNRATTEAELRKMQSEFTQRSAERDDHWRDVLVESNAQWQTYAQRQLEALQTERDKHIQQLVTNLEQARSDLQTATRESIADTVQFKQIIAALENKVAGLEQLLVALRNEIKVLTEQNTQLIKLTDITQAEKEILSAEIEASQTINIEEQQNVA